MGSRRYAKDAASHAEEGQSYAGMATNGFNGVRGEPQYRRAKDWTFSVLFLFHLGLVLYAFGSAFETYEYYGYGTLAFFTAYCAVFASIFSIAAFIIMVKRPRSWVRSLMSISSLIFLGTGIFAYLAGELVAMISSIVFFVLCLLYLSCNWKRIKYISANFQTAVEVIEINGGLLLVAFIIQLVAIAWSIVWLVACTWAKDDIDFKMIIIFIPSFFWVQQVLKNIMHVTVAGVVGRWWLTPSDRPSGALGRPLGQAVSTSFGSICFGSLFVNYFHFLRKMAIYTSDKEALMCPHCVISCLFGCARNVLVYMSKWSYVYIGLYGYSFFEGGKNVSILFTEKGWKSLLTDDLSDNIIFITNLALATLTGLAGWLFAAIDTHHYQMLETMYYHPYTAGFTIGFAVGYLISSVLLAVLGGTVNAIIVCFAERPTEFQINHPRQSQILRAGWALELPAARQIPSGTKVDYPSGYLISKQMSNEC